ncbi:TPA: hypothetical protein DIV48_02210 [Candidatus Kaiserbacteria bacterium]|nr:hypothetical protein [Candidatus Kaiserbacteria bacterium]
MKIQHAKSILLENDMIRKSFGKNDLDSIKMNVGLQILELRLIKNLTQKQLAKKIGTKQPSVARVERGAMAPSLTFLYKIAAAVDTELIPPKFAVVERNEQLYQTNNFPSYHFSNVQSQGKLQKNAEISHVQLPSTREIFSFDHQLVTR